MKSNVMSEAELLSDARLVEQSLLGDRDAFGHIVARYQSPICALAYSACGNIGRSEDLAQEIFITAWRQLRDLKDPAKLKAWLYGIARNLINKAFSQQSRNPLAVAEPLDDTLEAGLAAPTPPDVAITKEEEAILWRVLESMPENYREPMVLFYRQAESINCVAEVLGLSEEVVRQRLSRGRAMLNQRVAQVVQSGLRRSGPTGALGLAVLAALPAATAKAAGISAAGSGAVAAQSAGVAKGAGIMWTIAALMGAVGAAAGGIFAIWGRHRLARSLRERQFLGRARWGFLVWAIAFATTFTSHDLIINDWSGALAWGWIWLTLYGSWVAFAIWVTRRQQQIRREEGTPAAVGDLLRVEALKKPFKATIYGSLAAFIFFTQFWLALAGRQDPLFLVVLPVFSLALWLTSARAIVRRPEKTGSILNAVWWAVTVFVLAAVNLRGHVWSQPPQSFELPPLFVSFCLLGFYGSFGLAWMLERRLVTTRNFRRDAALAASAFGVLVLLGLILFLSGVSRISSVADSLAH